MMINAEEEKQLLNQLGVVESTQGTHYPQTVEFGRLRIFTALTRVLIKLFFLSFCLNISIHLGGNAPVIVMMIM